MFFSFYTQLNVDIHTDTLFKVYLNIQLNVHRYAKRETRTPTHTLLWKTCPSRVDPRSLEGVPGAAPFSYGIMHILRKFAPRLGKKGAALAAPLIT